MGCQLRSHTSQPGYLSSVGTALGKSAASLIGPDGSIVIRQAPGHLVATTRDTAVQRTCHRAWVFSAAQPAMWQNIKYGSPGTSQVQRDRWSGTHTGRGGQRSAGASTVHARRSCARPAARSPPRYARLSAGYNVLARLVMPAEAESLAGSLAESLEARVRASHVHCIDTVHVRLADRHTTPYMLIMTQENCFGGEFYTLQPPVLAPQDPRPSSYSTHLDYVCTRRRAGYRRNVYGWRIYQYWGLT